MKSTSSDISTERFESIVHTAEKLFADKGYQSVSVEEIARTAGVSKGLVSYHFGSKEDLLVHIINRNRGTLLEQLDDIARSSELTKAKLRSAIEAYLEAATSGLGITQMVLVAFFEVAYTEKIRNTLLTSLEENLIKFAALVDEGIARGELRPVDSLLTTHLVIGMALEMIRLGTIQQQPVRPDKIADEITAVLLDGIALK